MEYLSLLIKPASSLCNLNCLYCFYEDVASHREIKSHGFMSDETSFKIIDRVFEELDDEGIVHFAFQGGEPTLIGTKFFRTFIDYVNLKKKATQKIEYSIQTNAYLIDDKWCQLFKEYNFLVGVSLDGFKDIHDSYRLINNKPTFKRIIEAIELLRKYKIDFNVITVLTSLLAKYPQELYEFYKEKDFDFIQIIPCLDDLDNKGNEYALKPKDFYEFYKDFFDLWKEEFYSGKYRSVSFIDNLVLMFKNEFPHLCGMLGFCRFQAVIESDGSIYPCDFYVLDKYKSGNIFVDKISEAAKSAITKEFINEKKDLSKVCSNCEYYKMCYGNCKRMAKAYYNDNYCGYKEFINYAKEDLFKIARGLY